MRIWTFAPHILNGNEDWKLPVQGLWRETIMARNAYMAFLSNKPHGYLKHPQMKYFTSYKDVDCLSYLNVYLREVFNYGFYQCHINFSDSYLETEKPVSLRQESKLVRTIRQLEYELNWFYTKIDEHEKKGWLENFLFNYTSHPERIVSSIFKIVPGEVMPELEKIKPVERVISLNYKKLIRE